MDPLTRTFLSINRLLSRLITNKKRILQGINYRAKIVYLLIITRQTFNIPMNKTTSMGNPSKIIKKEI